LTPFEPLLLRRPLLSHSPARGPGAAGPHVELAATPESPGNFIFFCYQVFFDYVPSSATSLLPRGGGDGDGFPQIVFL